MKSEAINHPHQWFGGHSYAQAGSDMVVLNIFNRLGIDRPSYIDVGANDPWILSNTALLYKRGSRGINIDANADCVSMLKEERPEDINIWSAILHPRNIGSEPYTTLYRLNETSGLNSTVEENLHGHGGARDAVQVPAHTLGYFVQKHKQGKWPDYLSIDCEGRDFEILESIPWGGLSAGQLPKVICVEALSQVGDDAPALRILLERNGYYVHSWCGGNMIFVQIRLKHLLH